MQSTNIPTRRLGATRLARPKDTENANARTLRAKPPSTSGTTIRAVATTAASRAKAIVAGHSKESLISLNKDAPSKDASLAAAAGKRKREALGELAVAGANKPKAIKPAGSKDALSKPSTRIASSTFGRHSKPSTKVQPQPTEEELEPAGPLMAKSDNAMQVDDSVPPRIPALTPRLSASKNQAARRQFNASLHPDDAESQRAFKKRRTSSDMPTEFVEQDTSEARIAEELQQYADAEPEADPNGSGWDDLDADDADDPTMVSEYVVDIFHYLKRIEPQSMPSPLYMESQRELSWKMRGILTDWLIQVHVRFRLYPETLFLAVNLIDRFLSARVVSLAKLQLVGITCMFIAAKVEEVIAPSVTHFKMCAESSYTEDEIFKAERYVLKTLEWDMSYPNPMHYLRRISKADDFDVKVRTLAKYLLEIACLEWRLLATPPSLLAAASIWLARLALNRSEWTPNLAHYSSYPESAIIPTAKIMIDYILKPIRHESFYKKYAGKRYDKSSVYMRDWALKRWSEGQSVELSSELPSLKAAARKQREYDEMIAAQQALLAAEEEGADDQEA